MTAAVAQATLPASYPVYRALVAEALRRRIGPAEDGVRRLVAYHLGWRDAEGRPAEGPDGKLLRPVLCLTACAAFAPPERAVPVAVAVELLHAFSLVHDDIEDGDDERRGRPTLWRLVGVPLALNAGDDLFALAFATLHDAVADWPGPRALHALRLFTEACLRMIEGQQADLTLEAQDRVTSAEYAAMARAKTGALLGAALALGALAGGAPSTAVERLREAGEALGLAFQAVDDALAVWGDPARTGKAVGNDLARGKKALPIVLGLERGLPPTAVRDAPLEEVRLALERRDVPGSVQEYARAQADRAMRLVEAAAPAAWPELHAYVTFILHREG